MNNITQVALVVKNLPANAGGTKRFRLDPWVQGRSPGIGNGVAWHILWTEQPGGLQSMESQKSQTQLSTA